MSLVSVARSGHHADIPHLLVLCLMCQHYDNVSEHYVSTISALFVARVTLALDSYTTQTDQWNTEWL